MSNWAWTVPDVLQRLSRRDPTFNQIYLYNKKLSDAELAELFDCLLAHPDVATHVWLHRNHLTDKTGVKLARYLAASSTVESLSLSHNLFGSATYLALAAALRVNSSLCGLFLNSNRAVDRPRIDAAFVEALRLNPDRPAESWWHLYSRGSTDVDFERLKSEAKRLGHPSLQLLLVLLC